LVPLVPLVPLVGYPVLYSQAASFVSTAAVPPSRTLPDVIGLPTALPLVVVVLLVLVTLLPPPQAP
jgi:hypothetical protein